MGEVNVAFVTVCGPASPLKSSGPATWEFLSMALSVPCPPPTILLLGDWCWLSLPPLRAPWIDPSRSICNSGGLSGLEGSERTGGILSEDRERLACMLLGLTSTTAGDDGRLLETEFPSEESFWWFKLW